MSVYLSTASTFPLGWTQKQAWPMIQYTGMIKLNKGVMHNVFHKEKNEYQEIIDGFIAMAPVGANAIIGIQIATTVAVTQYDVNYYITYIGTPVLFDYA